MSTEWGGVHDRVKGQIENPGEHHRKKNTRKIDYCHTCHKRIEMIDNIQTS